MLDRSGVAGAVGPIESHLNAGNSHGMHGVEVLLELTHILLCVS